LNAFTHKGEEEKVKAVIVTAKDEIRTCGGRVEVNKS
jgi:hypothetical protein